MMEAAADASRRAAEAAAREAYGRLLSWLAWQWRDVQAAEDALADAFVAALSRWPTNGIPDQPEAWLMTVAKRNLLQVARHRKRASDPAVTMLLAEQFAEAPELPPVPDHRLNLMFVCAHPALDASVHTALMLQTVLGLEAKQIASAFLLAPSTLAQRLVRAKKKIRDAGLRFEVPEGPELAERLQAVLEAIYAAFGLGWDAAVLLDAEASELTDEALYLARLVVALQADSAEALGLLALLMFCEARRAARFDASGGFVPLHEQDSGRWDRAMIVDANQLLRRASALRQPGPFQLEAAIQSAHCQRAFTGVVPWAGIATLYEHLVRIAPTIGARVSQAVAIGEAASPADGLARLEQIDPDTVRDYQPYWVALAHLQARDGRIEASRLAAGRAIGLSLQPAIRRHLQDRYG